eukprot:751288-Hanusia_phi.AAC.1
MASSGGWAAHAARLQRLAGLSRRALQHAEQPAGPAGDEPAVLRRQLARRAAGDGPRALLSDAGPGRALRSPWHRGRCEALKSARV